MTDEKSKTGVPSFRTRPSSGRVILTWSVLGLCFMSLYKLFSHGRMNSLEYSFVGLFAVGVVVLLVLFWRNLRRIKRFMREQHVALAALHRGELEKARAMFWSWSESDIAFMSAMSRHNLAWTLMRQGELKQAIDVARDVLARQSPPLERNSMLPTTLVDLAMYNALLGATDAAENGMADLEQRKPLNANSGFPAMRTFTRAIIDCRSDRAAEAARVFEQNWAECEAVSTGTLLRLMRVVRSFAIANADARDIGKAEALISGAKPVFAGEYDFLGVAWPEMRTFLVTHGLATRAST
jgi:tetratricopeptide (TPR) repeat protein